ncbi:MAG: DNA polymerase III subunit beta [Acidobacteriota bacterium]
MEFTVKKSVFQKELNFVQGVIEKKATIPVLQHFLIRSVGRDQIKIIGTDMDLTIQCQCEAEIQKPGILVVQGRKLYDIVRNLPEADINLKLDEKSWAVLQCERSRFRIAGLPEEHFPAVPEPKSSTRSISAEVLKCLLDHTIYAIAKGESQRYALNGAQLELSANVGRMVATDGHRLSLVEHKSAALGSGEVKALIPRKAIVELEKLLSDAKGDEEVLFDQDFNHLYFQLGNRTLTTRTLSGKFPDYKQVIPEDLSHRITCERVALNAAIERASLMADDRSRGVKVRFWQGHAYISACSSEVGEANETIPVNYNGAEIATGFNHEYLIDFLQSTNSEQIYIDFKDVTSQAIFQPTNGDFTYLGVIMPMRV